MSVITSGKARVAALGVIALTAGSVGTLLVGGSAQAIPSYERSCAKDVRSITAASGWQPVNSVVTVVNGSSARNVVVNLNADAGVSDNAEIRIAYRIDGGPIQNPGAGNFANHTQYWQTRHSMVVLSVPRGTHTIRPYWRISGGAGSNGVIGARCLTAEAYTS